ncbi:histone deacetylase family protein [Pseudopelagicola sp. nBUS_19]|uniref:histone deacetylase family protein n=1 Tax=Pseudopelagicola sp. nBUS_19 TaxID=3395316 RepID=UPI003EBF416D
MKAFFDDRQQSHDPKYFIANGKLLPNPEVPARVNILKAGAEAAGCIFSAPSDNGLGPIAAIHTSEYITFLRNIHARWQRIDEASDEVIPNIHPVSRNDGYPLSAVGQAGYHQADTACPIAARTYDAAYWSAQTAISASDAICAGADVAYALSRPPGHHAFSDLAGGFCFFNNSAIAAQRLLNNGLRPAILDVDVHHGNGTQGIFYNRADVLTVSIHADPARFYPFFWGHSAERGLGPGLGANLNLPLSRGSDDQAFVKVLDKAIERIINFGSNAIVVALGLDAHVDDPFKGLAITTSGFAQIGTAIAATGLPLVLVQEGGYVSPVLGDNLTAFLTSI